MKAFAILGLCAAALLLAACNGRGREASACPTPQARPTPSGFCVPRWLSLKSGEVRARRGPGLDYPARWIYRSRGLPVQVVAETADWRQICDPDAPASGQAIWVHRSMVDGRRFVMAPRGVTVPLADKPQAGARANGLLTPRTLASLDRCEDGWCKVSAGGVSGWVAQNAVWGTAVAAQCR